MSERLPRVEVGSRALPARTVDINSWLSGRQNPNGGLRYPGNDERRASASQFAEYWQEREREPFLDRAARDCAGCQRNARHYIDDYICFRCREEFDAQ
jgi:hypothetical protein